MDRIKLADIKIKKSFKNSTPRLEKIMNCLQYWQDHKEQDRIIVLDKHNRLIDGYVQYLVLAMMEEDFAVIEYASPRIAGITTYVYGKHKDSNCEKEFVWRVSRGRKSFAESVQPGDEVTCATKYGLSQVIVTKVEHLDEPPIKEKIKKVVSKRIVRNGEVINF